MILYKYVGPERLSILTQREIAFSAPITFNDPFEMSPYYSSLVKPELITPFVEQSVADYLNGNTVNEVIEKELKSIRPILEQHKPDQVEACMNFIREYMEANVGPMIGNNAPSIMEQIFGLRDSRFRDSFAESLYTKMNEKCRVLSLSATCENILMWSHYGDSHHGFAVGLDSEHSFFDQRTKSGDPIRRLKPVEYCEDRPVFEGLTTDPTEGEAKQFADLLLFSKSKDWEYEQEWRMVHNSEQASRNIKVLNGQVSLFEIPAELIRCVVMGARSTDATRLTIRNVIDGNEMRHVKYGQAKLDPKRYIVEVDWER